MKRFLSIGVLIALTAASAWSIDTAKLKPTGYVNDFAHKLDPAGQQALEAYCANLERVTGVQMSIVLVDSLDDEPVEDVANRLYKQWGIGNKTTNEGLLILLSIKEHKSRAEIGYGLEPIITDGDAGGVLRDIRPILQQGNYAGALLAAAQQFGNQIAQAKGVALGGTPLPTGNRRPPAKIVHIPFPLIVIGFILLIFLLGRGGRGGGSGVIPGMVLGSMMGGRSNWGGGGFGGSDGGGGGGFGGFGGGSSGGGGASGGW